MKIALVTFSNDSALTYPNGVLSIASYCHTKEPSCLCRIIEAARQDAFSSIMSGGFDVIGMSAMTNEYEQATRLATRLKDGGVSSPIIIGGIHITKLPQSLRPCFDFGALGDGEDVMVDVARGVPFREIAGVFTRSSDMKSVVPRKNRNLSDFPPLDYTLIDSCHFSYRALLAFAEFGRMAPLMTSRGCPFNCIFCGGHRTGVRYHSPEWVVNECEALAGMGMTHIEIYDDLFAANKERLRLIVAGMEAKRLKNRLKFQGNAQAHILDETTCELLVQMGVKRLFFGFESGNQRVLSMLKCGKVDVDDNCRAIELCRKHGIKACGNMILGSPTETLGEMRDTIAFIRWARKHGAERITMSVMTPCPGTPVWDLAVKIGQVSDDMNFEDLVQSPVGRNRAGWVVDESISNAEFDVVLSEALKEMHPFKWKKLWSFMRNNPLATLNRARQGSMHEIKRMFVRKSI